MSEYTTPTPTPAPAIRRLERSSGDKVLAGVAGGLGRYFELSPNVFRLGFVVLTILGGAGVLVYLAAVLVMPAAGRDQSIAAEVLAERRDRPWPLIGLGLVGAALVVLLARGDSWPSSGAGWILILAIGLVVLWSSRRERRARRLLMALTGLAAIVVAALVVGIVAAFSAFDVSLGDGVGNHSYQPPNAAAVLPTYKLGFGKLVVDLSHVSAGTTRHVDARVGVGHLKIVLPHTGSVAVHSHANYGAIHQFGVRHSGHDVDVQSGNGTLTVDAKVGAGRIDVVRAP